MRQTEYSRRMDTSGRIVVPARLREDLKMATGDDLTFFIHEMDGRTFLCVEAVNLENEIDRAKRILREAGIDV